MLILSSVYDVSSFMVGARKMILPILPYIVVFFEIASAPDDYLISMVVVCWWTTSVSSWMLQPLLHAYRWWKMMPIFISVSDTTVRRDENWELSFDLSKLCQTSRHDIKIISSWEKNRLPCIICWTYQMNSLTSVYVGIWQNVLEGEKSCKNWLVASCVLEFAS